ncbi:MAG: lasso peptide biosynthesis B2 protein [Caulobacter sp.]
MSGEAFRAKPGLFAIYDAGLARGVVLDDQDGQYWSLDRDMLAFLRALAGRRACAMGELERLARSWPCADIAMLLSVGLVEPCVSTPQAMEAPRSMAPPPALDAHPSPHVSHPHRLPSAWAVLEYVWLNFRFQLEIRLGGWRPVRERRAILAPARPRGPRSPEERVEEALAAMRLAALVPLVSKRCIPRALTAFEFLRRRGLSPVLVVGGYVEPFEPHIWTEVNGQAVDSGHIDFSLDVFIPLPDLKDLDD